jgi:hypothetical protein
MRPVMNINNEDIDTGIHAGSAEASGISWSIGSMPGRNGTVRILEEPRHFRKGRIRGPRRFCLAESKFVPSWN